MEGVRSGKWTAEEMEFATRLIDDFRNGSLQIPEGTGMRAFLAAKLGCVPKRISKKYENTNYNGRLQFVRDKTLSAEESVRRRLHLEKLERVFKASVQEKETEATKEATKKQQQHQEKDRKPKASRSGQKERMDAKKGQVQAQLQARVQIEKERKKLLMEQEHTRQVQVQQQQTVAATAAQNNQLLQGSASPGSRAEAGLQAVADLERILKRNTAAASAANDELRSLLAARQRLAHQSDAFRRASLRPDANTLSAARANQILNTLSSLQQNPQPYSQPHPAQNPTASRMERLRFLRQIEMEQQQQRLLGSAASASSTTAGASKWNGVGFLQQQAKVSARGGDTNSLQQQQQSKATAVQLRVSTASAFIAGVVRQYPDGSNDSSYKRKQAPTDLLPDPKRPRHFK